MPQPLLYSELAPLYDVIYGSKGYRREAAFLRTEIRRYGRSGGRALLDVGCGTGHHLQYLRRWYDCAGVDLSPQMLQVAHRRLPGVPLFRQDMISLRMSRKFDAIVCMFGAIGYTRTVPRLQRAVGSMASLLRPGGVLVVQPWLRPSAWRADHVFPQILKGKGVTVIRVSRTSRPAPGLSRIDWDYLVARRARPVVHLREAHELGLFSTSDMRGAFEKAGLRPRFFPTWHGNDRGLWVAVAPGGSA